MTQSQALDIVRNFKAHPKETVSEAAMLILGNESAYLPEDMAEAYAAADWAIEGEGVTELVSEDEIDAIASRVVRGLCSDSDSGVSEEAILLLIADLHDDISNAIIDWATRPHPLAHSNG
jgi:hypothetical protein